MPEEELSLVKNIMTGEVMRILDGPFGIADVTIENLLCGTNNGVIEENIRRIQAITPAEVQRLAVEYLRREDLITAVVGAVTIHKIIDDFPQRIPLRLKKSEPASGIYLLFTHPV